MSLCSSLLDLGAFFRERAIWRQLQSGEELAQLALVEPADSVVSADEAYLDLVAEACARVIDAKSPWTYQQSNAVAEIAAALSANLGFDAGSIREIRRAARLQDLGKLAVSNLILDKPGRLTGNWELRIVNSHEFPIPNSQFPISCIR